MGNRRTTMKRKIIDAEIAEAHYYAAAARLRRAQKRLAAGLAAHNKAWAKSGKTRYDFAGSLNLVASLIEQAAEHFGK
jgi:hypothetical protein